MHIFIFPWIPDMIGIFHLSHFDIDSPSTLQNFPEARQIARLFLISSTGVEFTNSISITC